MKLVFPRLYAIMDSVLLRTSEIAFADILAASGVELIQYRNKQAPSGSLLQISLNLVKVLNPRHVRVIVNDRPDIARLADAGGVHVGTVVHNRSEEHTSELQSHSDLVCRLLLEKKNKKQT